MTTPLRTATVGEFLHALGQALAAMTLYGLSHPSRAAAQTRAHERLEALLAAQTPLRLTFLDGDVLVDRTVLREFREWEWGQRLSSAGVQRLEIETADVEHLVFIAWLAQVHAAVSPGGTPIDQPMVVGPIRFGPVGLLPDTAHSEADADDENRGIPRLALWRPDALRDEVEALSWVESYVASTNQVPASEVEAIVRGLQLAMQAEPGVMPPLIPLRNREQYITVHACNVALLSMRLAERLAYSSRDVRTIGVAALLHDIGKARLPAAILFKPDALTDAERLRMESHVVEGARLLAACGSRYGLASIVAYEHHVWANGQGGYPRFRFPRPPQYVTRLVQVCDMYDAMCTERPYRPAWSHTRTLHHMRMQAGSELDYELALAFFELLEAADH